LQQIFVSENFRWKNIAYEMLKKLFELNKNEYKDLPIILETNFLSRFYAISRSMWFEDIDTDKYGYVIQWAKKYSNISDFLDTNNSFSDEKIKSRINNYRSVVKKTISNESYSNKFYK
jgi:hypothetical protein